MGSGSGPGADKDCGSSASSSSRWRGRGGGKKVPVTMVVAMAAALVLVLGMLDLEGGFLRELRRSSVLQVGEEGGVAAPDVPHCLAKWQHLVYRKASLRFPTPGRVRELLAAYEAMHRRCTVAKDWERDEYSAWTARRSMAAADHPGGPAAEESDGGNNNGTCADACHYLFLQMDPGSGLGNRLLGIVSGFLYALLTNRALVVDPSEDIWQLLCEPFQGSSWFLPPTFPVQMVTNMSTEIKDAGEQEFPGGAAAVVTVRLKQDLEPSVRRFWCAHTQDQLSKVRWILWRSNQHLIPRFFSTPHFWPRLQAMFLTGADSVDPSTIFLHLSRHLILPRNPLWDRILRLYWTHMADARKRVGVQIRRHGSPKKLFSMEVHQRMMQCLIQEQVLPNTTADAGDADAGAGTVQHLTTRLRHIAATTSGRTMASPENAAADSTAGGRPIVVLIASLRPDYWEHMKATYTELPTADGSLVRPLQVTHDTDQRQSLAQMGDALVEMWLLSLADQLVISSWSTFGYIPIGLSGIAHAYVMNVRGETLRPEAACTRWRTADPCNHFPFLDQAQCPLDEGGVSQEQDAWLRRHVRPCETRTGIQLLSSSSSSS